jgi:hypothetical protein
MPVTLYEAQGKLKEVHKNRSTVSLYLKWNSNQTLRKFRHIDPLSSTLHEAQSKITSNQTNGGGVQNTVGCIKGKAVPGA